VKRKVITSEGGFDVSEPYVKQSFPKSQETLAMIAAALSEHFFLFPVSYPYPLLLQPLRIDEYVGPPVTTGAEYGTADGNDGCHAEKRDHSSTARSHHSG
jgi:hypothetical protein